MKVSELFTKTRKEAPAGEPSKNAQLLMRAGFVHKQMAGVYAYLPLGKKVIENITKIVREEMNAIGGQEVQLTALQPKELWEITDRWDDKKVDIWFKTQLKAGGELALAMSHEEPLTDLLTNYITSYTDLPLLAYQIGTKFRNELRAKSGLLRGREFTMKDMYSFARDETEHQKLFNEVKNAYIKIFERIGLGDRTFFTTASGGVFSSEYSYEFQTVTASGEDIIYLDRDKKIAINEEVYSDKVIHELGLNKTKLEKVKASEVGNIFNLGSKYSKPLSLSFLSEANTKEQVVMGCYGLGISRVMGVIAEDLSDEKGLVWPKAIAPAQVYLIRLDDDTKVIKQADELYEHLTRKGIEVLYDDRNVRPGEKFADADLIGLPYRVIVSKKTISDNKVELKARKSDSATLLTEAEVVETLIKK